MEPVGAKHAGRCTEMQRHVPRRRVPGESLGQRFVEQSRA
jgi:hypothetical protein